MSASQMSHYLKQTGKGSEQAGINAVYRRGQLYGVLWTLSAIVSVIGVVCLVKQDHDKRMNDPQKGKLMDAEGKEE